MVIEEERRTLENELRSLLAEVELVCEADTSTGLVDQAGEVVRSMLAANAHEALVARFPATLVTYFVCRGAEVYDRNEIWPPLGVVDNTTKAGQAFLRSLKRLGLTDFSDQIQRVGARRYVAPILIHGALPASVARRLVECLEEELRRGLVDGEEARLRLLRRHDLVHLIHRPAARLLEWCPEYAARLLDAVIDHIEEPDGDGISRLPLHLRNALRQDTERRKNLKRLRIPRVEFSFWSGIGPQLRGAEGQRWTLTTAGATRDLWGDDCVELSPTSPARVSGAGRQIEVWPADAASFFDLDDRPIASDVDLPQACVALLPASWSLWTADGTPVTEGDEGSLLSGAWSNHRSFVVRLGDLAEVFAGPQDDRTSVRRVVGRGPGVRLVGQVHPDAIGPEGSPVYTEMPRLELPSSESDRLRLRLTSSGGFGRSVDFDPSADATPPELTDYLPRGPISAEVDVIGTPTKLRFLVVPNLEIERPQVLLGPVDRAEVVTRFTDAGGTTAEVTTDAPAHVSKVNPDIPGIPEGSLSVPLPRVRWSLRSAKAARVGFADGPIRIDAATLASEPMWLLVRSGLPASVGAVLAVDGVAHQFIAAKPTQGTGPAAHHRSIPLEQLRDSIRAHGSQHLEVHLEVGAERVLAILCGEAPLEVGQRSWHPTAAVVRPAPNTGVLAGVPWIPPGNSREYEEKYAKDPLLIALRKADTPDAVVTFLRHLGHHQTLWKRTEFPVGPSATDWARFDEIAHAMWLLTGVRHREFTGDEEERLKRWARTRREACRRAPDHERRELQEWLARSYPDRALLTEWLNGDTVMHALPTRSDVTSEWFPGTVMFNILCLVAGDPLAGPIVEEAVALSPSVVLEGVAFVLQTLHNGNRIVLPPAVEVDEVDDQPPVPEKVPALATLLDCEVDVVDGSIQLSPNTECRPPVLRLVVGGRGVALVGASRTDNGFSVSVPSDLAGTIGLQLVDERSVSAACSPELSVTVDSEHQTRPPRPRRLGALSDLAVARRDALAVQIAETASGGVFARATVEELFEDEHDAAITLFTMGARGHTQREHDLALIACLPAAFLFSSLRLPLHELRNDPLAFAVLGPRDPGSWTAVGWPNAQTFHSGRTWTDLPGFIHRLVPRQGSIATPTFRYSASVDYPNPRRLDMAVEHLESRNTDPGFVDLVIATHRLLTIDRLVDEALRMLLTAYLLHPQAARSAVLSGVAAVLACAD